MAVKKGTQWLPLLTHAAVYTLTVYLLSLLAGGISWSGIALIFGAHIILDRREFVEFWTRHVTGATAPWLVIMVDQSWHIVVLAIVILLRA
jgi:hypothetical protein